MIIFLQFDELTHDGDFEEVRSKTPRLPATTSELVVLSSEKLKLLRQKPCKEEEKLLSFLGQLTAGQRKY